MIDIHTHCLPGIDDGPATAEEALMMLRLFVAEGVRHVVATPHVYPGRFDNDRRSIAAALDALRVLAAPLGLPLTLGCAGEVRLSEHLPDLLARDAIPFLGESEGWRNMLLELPDAQIPIGTARLLRWLVEKGIRPVIVHPERNRQIREAPVLVKPMLDLGCQLQLTAGSLLGNFGPRVERAARFMLDRDWVAALASDAHDCSKRRPCLNAARDWMRRHYDDALATRLTLTGPALLCGDALPGTEGRA